MSLLFSLIARRSAHMVLLLVFAVLVVGCGDGSTSAGSGNTPNGGGDSLSPRRAVDELRETGFAEYLGTQEPSRVVEDGAWTHYFFDAAEEGAICLVGDEFQVSVREGASDEALLYLQGGGACWDYATCHAANTALKTANGPAQTGIIDTSDSRNPFADFDIVYVPYCDGSVFTGDATVDYDGIRTYHHGFRNLSVAVDALTNNFPNPSRVVIAGSSAGGYGTYAGYGAVRVALPETPILVYNDSGPGVQNIGASEDIQNRVKNWNFTRLVPESCTKCDTQYSFLTEWAFERDPTLRTALYSYQEDSVISFFIDLSGPKYRDLILSVSGELAASWPGRFERFFPKGTTHTVLLGSEFYTQTVNGVSLLEWTRDFLDGSSSWESVVE
ncbi:MAG: pectin acetylesterase-family hydrolase [Candidatus Binatia bacterium]|nr:pectin acetylesterase-family hydrolase [Candidatus Binatia bacterium]